MLGMPQVLLSVARFALFVALKSGKKKGPHIIVVLVLLQRS